jgi:hypothetical protein
MELNIIIFLVLLILVLLYTTINLFIKNEKLTDIVDNNIDFIETIQNQIIISNKIIKEIDERGSFSSDDEIGWFFDNIKNIQENLNKFSSYPINNDKKN